MPESSKGSYLARKGIVYTHSFRFLAVDSIGNLGVDTSALDTFRLIGAYSISADSNYVPNHKLAICLSAAAYTSGPRGSIVTTPNQGQTSTIVYINQASQTGQVIYSSFAVSDTGTYINVSSGAYMLHGYKAWLFG